MPQNYGALEKVLRVGEGRRLKRLASQADYVAALEPDFEKLSDAELACQLAEHVGRDVADHGAVAEDAEVDLHLLGADESWDIGDGGRIPLALARKAGHAGLDPPKRPRVADVVVGGHRYAICGSMSP